MSPRPLAAFGAGGAVGLVGGMIGLGGAEFRLPLLAGPFGFSTRDAVVANLWISLVTVFFAFLFRLGSVPPERLLPHLPEAAWLLAGSLVGALLGVRIATSVDADLLDRIVMLLLLLLALVMIGHGLESGLLPHDPLPAPYGWGAALLAGVGIGTVSSLLGVAGGELLIPALILLFALEMKTAGSLSLAISLPTILVGLWRYRKKGVRLPPAAMATVRWMGAGSVLGAAVGGSLLGLLPSGLLKVALGIILVIAALKLFLHRRPGRNA